MSANVKGIRVVTAEELRQLMPYAVQNAVRALESTLMERAAKGYTFVRTGYEYKEDKWLWEYGCNRSPDWFEAKNILENLGYMVSFVYDEQQFFNMHTLIEWK